MQALMIAQVHDELVFDCPRSEVEKLKQIVKREMEDFQLRIKLVVEVGVGTTWANAK
jgi:DNA polymerase-1